MGTVYLAQDTLLDRPCAIKELYADPLADEAQLLAARKQFEREAKALMKLRHKNLPHVSDYFSIDENDYLVMDYIEGQSLADMLKNKKRPTEALMYTWLEQILDALNYCHSHQIIHRDIKPANIILTPEGRVMLVDFGLVKIVDPHNPRTTTIVRGLGTPEYTPLEQYDPHMGHTDERSDIYALGATIYHLLTGRPPQPVSQRILKPDTQPGMRELNPKISPWMEAFVRRAMAIRPEDRYQSVGEMRRELQARLFKVRQRRAQPHHHMAPEHAGSISPTESDQAQTEQSDQQPSAEPELSPLGKMAVPITTIAITTVLIAMISIAASSGNVIVIFGVIALSSLIYEHLFGDRRRGPPRF